jgi:hypothetical protein
VLDHDEALDVLHARDAELAFGLASHGPMAIEALASLGHRALVQSFMDVYAPRLRPLRAGRPVLEREREAARGCYDRFPDWVATLVAELRDAPWAGVVRRHAQAWLPGLFAGAAHGFLRTAHAVRALEAEDTPARRRELAHGLAYWAARHQRLPGDPLARRTRGAAPPADATPLRPAEVLRAIHALPAEARRPGLLRDAASALEADPRFAATVARLAIDEAELSADLHALCVTAAELYLLHPEQKIAYVHVLTVPSAVRLVAAHLAPQARADALAFATQAAAALHAISADPSVLPAGSADAEQGSDVTFDRVRRESALRDLPLDPMVERLANDPDEIRYRAACSLDEHAIKYADACLREHRVRGERTLCLAAADAALTLSPATPRGC